MAESVELPDQIDCQYGTRISNYRRVSVSLLDTIVQIRGRITRPTMNAELDQLWRQKFSILVVLWPPIFNLRGMLTDVGIEPVFAISEGSRTSIRSFSGWLGRSLTSS